MGRPSAIELLDIVCPGVRARLEAYGGEFIDATIHVPPSVAYDANGQLFKISVGVRLVLPDEKVIQIITRNTKDGPIWRNSGYYSFHCGPSKGDPTEVFFRIDRNRDHGLHCHILGQGRPGAKTGGHLSPREVRPDIIAVDVLRFLDYVDEFLRTGVIPFTRFGP